MILFPFAWLFCIIEVTRAVSYGQAYDYYLLVNPGLSPSVTTSTFSACIDLCRAAGNCSAVSYSAGGRACVLSYCSILHAVKNNGWNTYLLSAFPIESTHYSAPVYEWMTTDACGLSSTGTVSGVPSMNLTSGASFSSSPSQSQYVGNALQLSLGNVYAISATSFFNVGNFVNGFTFSAWYYYDQVLYAHAYFEFGDLPNGVWNGQTHFWRYNGGLFYNLLDWPSLSPTSVTAAHTPTVGVWTHITLVYDPVTPSIGYYVNGSLYSIYVLNGRMTNATTSHYWILGNRPGDTTSRGITGRTYCQRMHFKALSGSDLWANALACNGRIRIS